MDSTWSSSVSAVVATSGGHLRIATLFGATLVFGCLTPASAGAQTADRARLAIGVGIIHVSGGGELWRVGDQPLFVPADTDTVAVTRRLTSGFGAVFSGAFFPNDYFGVGAEVLVMGLGYADGCRIVRTRGSSLTSGLCTSLNNAEHSAIAFSMSTGIYLKPGFRGTFQPYVRVMGGFASLQQSLVRTEGEAATAGGLVAGVTLYDDSHTTSFSPYLNAGLGVAAAIGGGFQFRWEVREQYLRLPSVTGPTRFQGLVPPSTNRGRTTFGFSVGVDVLLARRRGRRY